MMEEVYDFLKTVKTYYIATREGDQPRVRPFGTVNIFEGRLYVQTGRKKACYEQMKDQKVELCACKEGSWLRVSGTLTEDPRVEAEQDMLDHYPELQSMYRAGDGNNCVLYFQHAVATFSSFSEPPRVCRF